MKRGSIWIGFVSLGCNTAAPAGAEGRLDFEQRVLEHLGRRVFEQLRRRVLQQLQWRVLGFVEHGEGGQPPAGQSCNEPDSDPDGTVTAACCG